MVLAVWAGAFAALTIAYYFFFGPGPTPSEALDVSWYTPRGWAVRSAMLAGLRQFAEDESGPARLVPVLLFAVPPVALLAIGFRITRGAAARAAGTALALTATAFVYYGYLAPGVWRFFSWRWPAVTLCMAAIVAAALFAPSLLRAALARPLAARAAALVLAFGATYFMFTEITGTNPELQANLSPWPLLTLFGLLLLGRLLGAIHLGAGLGEWATGSRPGAAGALLAAAIAAVVAAGGVWLLGAGAGAGLPIVAAILALPYALALRWLGASAGAPADGAMRALAGVLVVVMIGLANWRANAYQETARDQTSAQVIAGLEAYRAQRGVYPDDLAELVPEFLSEVPRPAMGLIPNSDEVFTYSNFGDSYALEFSSVLWVQCAYSPPYTDDAGAEESEEDAPAETSPDVAAGEEDGADGAGGAYATEDAGSLAGSWSCDRNPPKLW
jgi:hypothetical protein